LLIIYSGIGISYATSKLTVPQTQDYGQVVVGERFPFAPIVRLADWHIFDAQDLVPSDGKFKLIILPGDLLHSKSKAALFAFADGFQTAIDKRRSEAKDESRGLKTRLSVYTVARNAKEDIIWKDIPSELVESWRLCVRFQMKSSILLRILKLFHDS
jgi:hypothetical protein